MVTRVPLFSDPRIEHVAGDGRLFLRQAGRRFDIIEADALRPSSAYSASLYSVSTSKYCARTFNRRASP